MSNAGTLPLRIENVIPSALAVLRIGDHKLHLGDGTPVAVDRRLVRREIRRAVKSLPRESGTWVTDGLVLAARHGCGCTAIHVSIGDLGEATLEDKLERAQAVTRPLYHDAETDELSRPGREDACRLLHVLSERMDAEPERQMAAAEDLTLLRGGHDGCDAVHVFLEVVSLGNCG